MDKRLLASKITRKLYALYPEARTELRHSSPVELLVSTILSAQCTDERVNMVTKSLFKKYKTARDFADAQQAELEKEVRSTGFYRMKAGSIRQACRTLVEEFDGSVPKTMDEMLKLKGVARKTANVVLGSAYGIASGVVVDTHVKRLAGRMGLSREKDPVKIEADLMKLVDRKDWIVFGHAMVLHGRRVCRAARPDCPGCALKNFCPSYTSVMS